MSELKRNNRLIAGGVIFLAIIIFAVASSHSRTTSPAAADSAANAPVLSATADFTVTNPANIRVYGEVHNNGATAYAPTCTVHAHDASGAYDGLDIITDNTKIEPGKQWNFGMDLTITHEGAGYVTVADIKCS